MEDKWKKWSLEETNCLLALWSSPEVQSKLVGTRRTKPAYEQIQHGMSTAGYNRSLDQIVNIFRKLKTEYRELKKSQSGSEQPQSNPYFKVLDSVLGDRPACQLTEAVNSSAAIVKMIVDDKVLQTFNVPELPQYVCKKEEEEEEEKEVVLDQQLCKQESDSSLDQEDSKPPKIKEEQEELCTSQDGEQLVLKQETDTFMLTPTYDQTEFKDQSLLLHPEQTLQGAAEDDPLDKIQIVCVKSETDTYHVADNQNHRGENLRDSAPMTHTVPEPKKDQQQIKTPKEKPYKCCFCEKTFSQSGDLTKHRRTHTGEKPYVCSTCGKTFICGANMKRHMRTHTGDKPHICSYCSKSYYLSKNLKVHMRIHTGERPYKCSYCEKTFTCPSTLKRHTKTHTGEKAFKCRFCGKMFAQVAEVTSHMRTHTGEKPYVCVTCGKNFTCGANLNRHIMIHTGETPYTCSDCGKGFKDSTSLKNHFRVHTGEKPYECPACGKKFTMSTSLAKHIRIHTGDRPYKCDTCGISFFLITDLRAHVMIHTGERPFKCYVCGDGFRRKGTLKKHMKVHKGVSLSISSLNDVPVHDMKKLSNVKKQNKKGAKYEF